MKGLFVGRIVAIASTAVAVLGAGSAAIGAEARWSPVQVLSAPGEDATSPAVAVSSRGEVITAWQRSDETHDRIEVAIRRPGGDFEGPVMLSPPGSDAGLPKIAIDARGDALAVWERSDGTRSLVEGALRPQGLPFGPPRTLSGGSADAFEPQLGASDGSFLVCWYRSDGTDA